MDILISILGVILTIFFIVGIHEFGHFIIARLCGIKVLCFSIGFGKSLYRWYDKKGTEYIIAAIPLGGYVKMLDEAEGAVPANELHLAFNRQPLYKRVAVIIAGPLFNFIFAFFIYWFIFIIGFNAMVPLIGNVEPNSIAAKAGIKPQDEIIRVADRLTQTWPNVIISLGRFLGDKQSLTIETKNTTTHAIQKHILDLNEWKIDALKPDPLDSLGIKIYEPIVPATIGKILPDSAAAQANLKVGDTLLSIGDKNINDWSEAMELITEHPTQTLLFKIKRENNVFTIPITIGYKKTIFLQTIGFLGITPQFDWPKHLIRFIQYNPLQAFLHAEQNTADFVYLNFLFLGKMILGKISLLSLGGPISIFQSAGDALHNGIIPFFSFLAFLSIAIGVINILPIPGLDGGHLLIYCIESIIGRPLSHAAQLLLFRFGLIILMILLAQAISNDIMRL